MKLEALPKGFRFRPTDEELINHYLRLKINGRHSSVKVIPEIDVCKWEPWDLPALSVIKSDDPEWFFFCARDRKYPNGHRSNRATEAGYWKATGKDRTIKSRRSSPSGCSNIHLIGMKKTLVFYKGRAPKGERTNWIMHEYRATEPDLDGSGPEQGDYVLCRLFHKADEKLDSSKYDEVEPTGSSPSANKSSPDDESSDLLGTEALDELEDVKKRLPHETDCKNTTILVPVESRESDRVDYAGEERAMEVYSPIKEIPKATYDQFDDKVLDAIKSENYTDPGANIGSPFANDFGNDHNELQFQDGTSEKDVSLSELLEGLQNHGNYFDEESSSLKNLVISNQRHLPGQRDGLEQTPTNIGKINEETDIEMVQEQGQTFPGFLHVSSSADHSLSYNAVEKDDSYVNIATTSSYKPDHSDSGTGIKIRSRQQQNRPNSDNSTIHGTTSRRIRLWVEREPKSICRENPENAQKSQSHITEAVEESPVKHSGENGREKVASSFRVTTSWSAQTGYMKVYVVSFYLVLILLVIFVGIWRCPSLHVLQG